MTETFEIAGDTTREVPAVRIVGQVWIDHLATGLKYSRTRLARAFFAPGARTVWHRHWDGQILHVERGVLLYQEQDQPVQVAGPGETIVCPTGTWHWHGADGDHFLTQMAVIEVDQDGQDADWGDQVSDEDYQQALEAASNR